MLVRMVSCQDFYDMFPIPGTEFDTQAFTQLNAGKVAMVRHLVGFDEREKPRLGITVGSNGHQWRAPFSAPFAMPACNEPQSPEHIYDFFSELVEYLELPLELTLPPAFYAPALIAPYGIVLGNMASMQFVDYNYHYPLEKAADYEAHLDRSARKNYHRALEADFDFLVNAPLDRTYAVIAANRKSHGYPLAMTFEQVNATIQPAGPIPAHCFLLTLGKNDVAAALVYDVAPGIGQVIYWGDAPGFSEHRPMNLLPKLVFDYYHERGYHILDIGPSSSRGVPSAGLCRFKASLGCELTAKPTFRVC
ncbi:MAG: hypothetical protein LIP09_06275 [Bacteroidales bacterium]|nr:hypothetical protein [Bacteroidales bacterium]